MQQGRIRAREGRRWEWAADDAELPTAAGQQVPALSGTGSCGIGSPTKVQQLLQQELGRCPAFNALPLQAA